MACACTSHRCVTSFSFPKVQTSKNQLDHRARLLPSFLLRLFFVRFPFADLRQMPTVYTLTNVYKHNVFDYAPR